eukprot:scaffold4749_cov174-Ochromonas_danica.AAC.3
MTSQYIVGYASDIEGGWEYWKEVLNNSSVLEYDEIQETLILKDHSYFIFGGDVCDRGTEVLSQPAQAYWVGRTTGSEEGKLTNRVDRLKWILKYTMGAPLAFECHRQELKDLHRPYGDEDVVDSFLQLVTPGHPEAYLLQYLQEAQMAVVIEDTLYVHGGINDTNLGFIPQRLDENGNILPSYTINNLTEWVKQLNQFAVEDVQHYTTSCQTYLEAIKKGEVNINTLWDIVGGYSCSQPGSRLVQCGMNLLPDNIDNPSVTYCSYLLRGEPVELTSTTAEWLKEGGVKKVIVGHQPNGDAPFLMDRHGIWVPTSQLQSEADKENVYGSIDSFLLDQVGQEAIDNGLPQCVTSIGSQANTRHLMATAEVCVLFDHEPQLGEGKREQTGTLYLHGRLGQGSSYDFTLQDNAKRYIGKKNADNWYVKAEGIMLCGQSYYLLSHSKGFDFRNRLVSEKEIDLEGIEL